MKSTLIEMPPELTLEESSDYFIGGTVEEIADRGKIVDERVLNRLLVPGDRFGDYEIQGFISSGGMGEVYVAERVFDDGRRFGPVALKVICEELANDWAIKARFKREAEISRAIRSPRVIRVYEIGETDQKIPFLAMELLQGEELFERLCTCTSFTAVDTAELFLQILDGIAAVHNSGFIHRDLKPENIFLAQRSDGREVVKIIDFGIAKSRSEASDPYLSVVGQIYGTPEYLSPEQCLSPDVDHRADLYSIGIMMYECVSGSLPFSGETPYAVILAQQNATARPLPSSVDPEFASIIEKAIIKDANERYQSAQEMLADLRQWLAENAEGEEDLYLQKTSQEMNSFQRPQVSSSQDQWVESLDQTLDELWPLPEAHRQPTPHSQTAIRPTTETEPSSRRRPVQEEDGIEMDIDGSLGGTLDNIELMELAETPKAISPADPVVSAAPDVAPAAPPLTPAPTAKPVPTATDPNTEPVSENVERKAAPVRSAPRSRKPSAVVSVPSEQESDRATRVTRGIGVLVLMVLLWTVYDGCITPAASPENSSPERSEMKATEPSVAYANS